jgi:hypothetical protein
MAQDGILTNISAVQDALRVYGLVVKKEADLAIRNKMADIAFAAAKNTKFRDRAVIRSEISNLPITKDGGKKRYGNTQYVGQYKLINWERKQKGLDTLGNSRSRVVGTKIKVISGYNPISGNVFTRYITKQQRRANKPRQIGPAAMNNKVGRFMDGKYRSFIKAREESSKFLRIGWARAAEFFGKPFKKGRDFGPKTIARISGELYGGAEVKKFGGDLTEYAISNQAGRYDVRRRKVGQQTAPERSSQDQERAAAVIEQGLNLGLQEALADILKYFETRMPRVRAAMAQINKFK